MSCSLRAPFGGQATMHVAAGASVLAGECVATIEAMKLEADITAPVAGTVERLGVTSSAAVDGGDLLLVLR